MKKERGLESRGCQVSPIDGLVKAIEHAGVLEGVENERHEAEDVEVGGLRGGPAAEQDIDANAEIGERDETESVVARSIEWLKDDRDLETGT